MQHRHGHAAHAHNLFQKSMFQLCYSAIHFKVCMLKVSPAMVNVHGHAAYALLFPTSKINVPILLYSSPFQGPSCNLKSVNCKISPVKTNRHGHGPAEHAPLYLQNINSFPQAKARKFAVMSQANIKNHCASLGWKMFDSKRNEPL